MMVTFACPAAFTHGLQAVPATGSLELVEQESQ